MSTRSKRTVMTLGVFAASLLAIAAIAAIFGGADSFLWVLRHGALGPLAVVVLHKGHLNAGNVPLVLVLASSVLAGILFRAKWLMPLALISAVAWVLVGMSVGV